MMRKIPLKVVLPFLVVTLVVISLMQFGKQNAMRLLQTKNSRIMPATARPALVNLDSGGVSLTSSANTSNLVQTYTNRNSAQSIKCIHHSQDKDDGAESSKSKCEKTETKLVFIKTHKTASTTLTTLFERFAHEHNLTLALPWVTHIFNENKPFSRDMVMTFENMKTFDMLANHARFDRAEMEAVVPHAKFVTIIRDPVTQFESAFGYFEMAKNLGLSKKSDPLAAFLENPTKYFTKEFHMKSQSYNGQTFDLGLNHIYHNNTEKVDEYITKVDREMDLVMLTEYFDESLILLKKLMCWNDTHILYLSKGIRNQKHRQAVSATIAGAIRKWNAVDQKLYQHFNRTFWQKVCDYGPDFSKDLRRFRQLQKNLTVLCLDTSKENSGDYRQMEYAHKKNAPDICKNLQRNDQHYVRLIRWREVRREFGLPKLLTLSACGLVILTLLLTMVIFAISTIGKSFCRKRRKNRVLTISATASIPH